jgi:hypothetical protein
LFEAKLNNEVLSIRTEFVYKVTGLLSENDVLLSTEKLD